MTRTLPRLRVGQHFIMPGEEREYEVLRVNDCAATVRACVGERREFETAEGDVVEFDAPGRVTHVSPHSAVEVLG